MATAKDETTTATSADETEGDLVAHTTTGTVSVPADAPMPPVEPGHKGTELNPGEIFDPNAARRFAEDRPPGLQDSEIKEPAHWVQQVNYDETPEGRRSYLASLEREVDQYDRPDTQDRLTDARKERDRIKALEHPDEKAAKS